MHNLSCENEFYLDDISKAEPLPSFWYRGPGELGNGLEFTLKAALQGCLPFKQTTRVEILCINIKQENLTWCENDPLQSKSA